MSLKRPNKQVSSNSWKNVILLALIYVIRLTDAAAIDMLFESSNAPSSAEITSPSPPTCKLISNSTLDCSNLKLSALPKSIPNTVLHLNMSNNDLHQIDDEAFDQCCSQLISLDLSNNGISSIHRRHFEKLKSLEVLLLTANKLTAIDADTFADSLKLKRLDLGNNSIQLSGSSSKGFLVIPNLIVMNLDFCDLQEIPDGSFTNMTRLGNLTLKGNPLENSLDTGAFEPLHDLIWLEIANVSVSSIYSLCEKLVSIDTISLEGYTISCTILSDGEPFEESINPNDPIEQFLMVLATTKKPTTVSSSTTSSLIPSSTIFPSVEETSSKLPPLPAPESNDSTTKQVRNDPESAMINIDNETMKFILIGIFGITIVGILIGLICRADICGVKTKLCRSKKNTNNRREPADTVSPFEEIPLKTVVNGKTTEGQG